MSESPPCAQCGHPLGVGRYCTNCGLPVEGSWRTDTAERPAAPPTQLPGVPPPVFEAPPGARYPLYADQTSEAPATVAVPTPAYPPPPRPPGPPGAGFSGPPTSHRRRRGALPWLVAAVAVLLLALVGALLLFGGDPDDDTASDPGAPASRPDSPTAPPSSTPPSPEPTSPSESAPSPDGPAQDLTGTASVSAPVTAPPGTEVDGDPVDYSADNMLDGVPSTAWRMPGSGVGREITIDLGGPVQLGRVGLVNGYTKRDPGYDGYTANRRITRVVWVFDDGSEQAQLLDEVRRTQLLDVGPITTSSITLRIVSVSEPASGPRGRDYTAISELALFGTPG